MWVEDLCTESGSFWLGRAAWATFLCETDQFWLPAHFKIAFPPPRKPWNRDYFIIKALVCVTVSYKRSHFLTRTMWDTQKLFKLSIRLTKKMKLIKIIVAFSCSMTLNMQTEVTQYSRSHINGGVIDIWPISYPNGASSEYLAALVELLDLLCMWGTDQSETGGDVAVNSIKCSQYSTALLHTFMFSWCS